VIGKANQPCIILHRIFISSTSDTFQGHNHQAVYGCELHIRFSAARSANRPSLDFYFYHHHFVARLAATDHHYLG